MATTEKIRKDIEKTREKIAEQQKRLRALEAQLTEEENLEIVRMVKAVRMDNRELTAFLTSTKAAQRGQARAVLEKVVGASRARVAARQHRKRRLGADQVVLRSRRCGVTETAVGVQVRGRGVGMYFAVPAR